MVSSSASGYSRSTMMGLVSVLTFGLTALAAVLGGGTLVPVIFILGFFILVPLIAILGDEFPLVEPEAETPAAQPQQDPLETLRDRFARGEIDQAEFERRLEYLVETEGLDFDVERKLGHLSDDPKPRGSPSQESERGLDRELEQE